MRWHRRSNPSLQKIRASSYCMFNMMTIDVLATQGAKVLIATALHMFSINDHGGREHAPLEVIHWTFFHIEASHTWVSYELIYSYAMNYFAHLLSFDMHSNQRYVFLRKYDWFLLLQTTKYWNHPIFKWETLYRRDGLYIETTPM